MHTDIVLATRDLAIGFRERTLIEGIDLNVRRGECCMIMGHNAAGKTTMLRTLWGDLNPRSGLVRVFERDPQSMRVHERIRLGARYLGQGDRQFGELTVRASRKTLCRLYGFDPSVPGKEDHMPEGSRIRNLSGGQRRWEAVQLLAAGAPSLYILDEPTAGLDPKSALRIVRWAADMMKLGAAFIVAEHRYRDWLECASQAVVVRSGEVTFQGSPEELRNPAVLARVYL